MNAEVKDLLDEATDLLTKAVDDVVVATDGRDVAALVELGARRLVDRRVLVILNSVTDEVYDLPETLVEAYLKAKWRVKVEENAETATKTSVMDDSIPYRLAHDRLEETACALVEHVLREDHLDWALDEHGDLVGLGDDSVPPSASPASTSPATASPDAVGLTEWERKALQRMQPERAAGRSTVECPCGTRHTWDKLDRSVVQFVREHAGHVTSTEPDGNP